MSISNNDILKYEKEFVKIIEKAFIDNAQTIIANLFSDMSKENTFPLTSIDENIFATDFWNNFLSGNPKIKPVSCSIVDNCIVIEKKKYIVIYGLKKFLKKGLFYTIICLMSKKQCVHILRILQL